MRMAKSKAQGPLSSLPLSWVLDSSITYLLLNPLSLTNRMPNQDFLVSVA